MESSVEEERHVVVSKNNTKGTTELSLEDKVELQEKKASDNESQISTNCSTNVNSSTFELDDDMIIIRRRDIEKLTKSYPQLESLDSKLGIVEDKRYEEWVYVDTDRSTFKIQEDLLLLSSVYGDERSCCVLQ